MHSMAMSVDAQRATRCALGQPNCIFPTYHIADSQNPDSNTYHGEVGGKSVPELRQAADEHLPRRSEGT